MITLLGYMEAIQHEQTHGKFDYSVSINDANPEPSFRVYGSKATLLLNFNDVWLNENGKKTIWNGINAYELPDEVAAITPLPGKDVIEKFSKFCDDHPDFENANSLIHCWAGVSRSSSFVMYLILCYGMSIEYAISSMLETRPIVRPNLILSGYMEEIFDMKIVDYLKNRLDYTRLA